MRDSYFPQAFEPYDPYHNMTMVQLAPLPTLHTTTTIVRSHDYILVYLTL